MIIRRLALAAFLTVALIPTLFAKGRMDYTVDLRETKEHKVHVTLVPTGYTQKKATFQMPIWAPGAYSVTHYGRYVHDIKAFDKKGSPLTVTQENDDRWSIANGKSVAKIEYDILDSHKDTTSLYFAMANMDTSLFFANATALFGYYDDDKAASASVYYQIPSGWEMACALYKSQSGMDPIEAKSNPYLFGAKDYDALVDAPVAAAPMLHFKSFAAGSANYNLVVASNSTFSDAKMDSLSFYLQKIVLAETDFFHDTPFTHYMFLMYAPSLSHMPSFAQGALEHMYSSDYLLANFNWSLFKRSFLSIFSHEFFHLWNVKRIHSSLLGPFDYTKRVMTTSLWMAEGITEYYAHTLLTRYGIIPPSEFYDQVIQWNDMLPNVPESSKTKSLEQLSIDESAFDLDEAELFYVKGPLVGLMLDLEIRSRTNNKKSLDDVMFALNNDAKHGKTFKDAELIHKVEKIAGIDLTDFYNRYIHGTDSLPIDRYLAMMGVSHTQSSSSGQASLGLSPSGGITVATLDSNSSFGRAGIRQGDEILALNGTKVTLDNIDLISAMKDSLTSATVTIRRDGQTMEIPVTFKSIVPHHKKEGSVEVDLDAPPLAGAMRKGIVGHE